MQDVLFGFQAAAADAAGVPDDQLYRGLIADCALGHELGYDAAWLLEHHFSDYYPTPSPLLMMAHIAAKFPDLSLGTSVRSSSRIPQPCGRNRVFAKMSLSPSRKRPSLWRMYVGTPDSLNMV